MFRSFSPHSFKSSFVQSGIRTTPFEWDQNVFFSKDRGHLNRYFGSRVRKSKEEKKPEEKENLPVTMVTTEGMEELLADPDAMEVNIDGDSKIE